MTDKRTGKLSRQKYLPGNEPESLTKYRHIYLEIKIKLLHIRLENTIIYSSKLYLRSFGEFNAHQKCEGASAVIFFKYCLVIGIIWPILDSHPALSWLLACSAAYFTIMLYHIPYIWILIQFLWTICMLSWMPRARLICSAAALHWV
jgi:hypothetical protein